MKVSCRFLLLWSTESSYSMSWIFFLFYFSRDGDFSSTACKTSFPRPPSILFLASVWEGTEFDWVDYVVMQIMTFWDNMLFLRSIRQYRLPLILARISLISVLFIPHRQVQALLKLLVSAVIGMVHQFPVKCHLHMHFLLWIFITKIGSIILRPFPRWTIVLVLISHRLRPLPKDLLLESVPNYRDPGV